MHITCHATSNSNNFSNSNKCSSFSLLLTSPTQPRTTTQKNFPILNFKPNPILHFSDSIIQLIFISTSTSNILYTHQFQIKSNNKNNVNIDCIIQGCQFYKKRCWCMKNLRRRDEQQPKQFPCFIFSFHIQSPFSEL